MVVLLKDETLFEGEDNFQKQTYRNRMAIYGPSGKQLLSVPVKHTKKNENHQKYKDVKVDDSFNWQKQHWKTLETAYRTSPFFEFYEDELMPFFEKKHKYLMDMNMESVALLCDCLQVSYSDDKTAQYEPVTSHKDYRLLVNAKSDQSFNFTTYFQVFGDKHGFLENLSTLDLLFNEGPNATAYLRSQQLPW